MKKTNRTLNYYEFYAETYALNTSKANLELIYDRFTAYLCEGANVLDAGCGSGRDTLVFRKKGYHVTAMDGAEAMCLAAEKNIGAPVLHLSFSEMEFERTFDGVWACASLLHLSETQLGDVLQRMFRALKERGVLYASWKYGWEERWEGERFFCDFTEEKLYRFLKGNKNWAVSDCWTSEDGSGSGRKQKWLNVILRKG